MTDAQRLAEIELNTVSRMYQAIEVFAAVVHASASSDPEYVRVPRTAFARLGEEMVRIAHEATDALLESGFIPEDEE